MNTICFVKPQETINGWEIVEICSVFESSLPIQNNPKTPRKESLGNIPTEANMSSLRSAISYNTERPALRQERSISKTRNQDITRHTDRLDMISETHRWNIENMRLTSDKQPLNLTTNRNGKRIFKNIQLDKDNTDLNTLLSEVSREYEKTRENTTLHKERILYPVEPDKSEISVIGEIEN